MQYFLIKNIRFALVSSQNLQRKMSSSSSN